MKHSSLCILATLLALVLLLAGCSAAAPNDGMSDTSPGENNASGTDSPSAGDNGLPGDTAGDYERKIIRTVYMSCESKAYDDALTTVMSALTAHGGYVESSSASGGALSKSTDSHTSARRAEYTLRVPAERLDAFLETLRTNGNIHITDQSMTSNEITGTYYDTKTRIETLTAEKESLTAMLEGFTDYKDISAMLEVQRRLYDVIEEIEAYQTKLNLYDSQVALSTVHLTLREVIEYSETAELTFFERIGDAFTESWTDFGRGWLNFAVWFVEAFPTLLILGAIATVVTLIVKRQIKRNKSKKNPS